MLRVIYRLTFWLAMSYPLLGCGEKKQPSQVAITPSQGSMFGYYDIELDLEGLNWTAPEISDVLIGESPAISLVALNERKLRFQVHGSPVAGNASVRLFRHDGAEIPSGVVFKFLPPNTTETMSIGAIGASLTQGVQRGVPSTTSILAGPAARFAQQLGVYFPLPLLIPDAFREMEVSDLGPPPYCNPPALDTFQQEQAIDLIDSIDLVDSM